MLRIDIVSLYEACKIKTLRFTYFSEIILLLVVSTFLLMPLRKRGEWHMQASEWKKEREPVCEDKERYKD